MKKTAEKYMPYIKLNVLMLLFMLALLWINPIDHIRSYVSIPRLDFTDRFFVYADQVMVCDIYAEDEADGIELLMSSEALATERYSVVLKDSEGSIVSSWTSAIGEIPEDALMHYHIKSGLMKAGCLYKLEISAPTLDRDHALMVSQSVGEYKDHANVFAIAAIVTVFLTANLCMVYLCKGKEFPAFPVLLSAGLIMLFIMAPGSGPDDKYHYYSSYILSDRMLGRNTGKSVDGGFEFDLYSYEGYVGCNANSSFLRVLREFGKRSEAGSDRYAEDVWTEPRINPPAHLAPAVGMVIGKLLGLNFISIYTLGRICNMLMYVCLAYAAVKIVPKNRELMIFVAMMPMAMQQCTGLSYDAIVNGISLFYIAYVLRMIYTGKNIDKKDISILILSLGIIAVVKVVYVLLALLLIMFVNKSRNVFRMVPVIIIPFIILLITRGRSMMRTVTHADKGLYTLIIALREPIKFLKLIIHTIETNGWTYLKASVGSLMTGDFTPVPEWLTIAYLVIIVLCVLSESEAVISVRWHRYLVAGTTLSGIISILVVFAFACTFYGMPAIQGVQGRYFIPFLIPPLFCLCGSRIRSTINRTKLIIPVWFIELGYIISLMSQIKYDI